jgi:hypothetical protein
VFNSIAWLRTRGSQEALWVIEDIESLQRELAAARELLRKSLTEVDGEGTLIHSIWEFLRK